MAKETVICTYRVRPDREHEFAELLRTHWTMLHELGFVTDDASTVYRGLDGRPTYVEIYTWVDGGFSMAHEHPDVLAVWETMGDLLEDRGPLPKWEFPHFEPLDLAR